MQRVIAKKMQTWNEPCNTCIKTESNEKYKLNPLLEIELFEAEQAIEKQTAKKVIVTTIKSPKGSFTRNNCPHCNEVRLKTEQKTNYCPDCGQKLDWSE